MYPNNTIDHFEQVCIQLNKAETEGDYTNVGVSYTRLAQILSPHYPALSLSLLRTGEIVMQDKESINQLIKIRIAIIHAYMTLAQKCHDIGNTTLREVFHNAAIRMTTNVHNYIKTTGTNGYDKAIAKAQQAIKHVYRHSYTNDYNKQKRYILDILEDIAIEEELNALNQKPQIASILATGHYAENRYMPMSYSMKERNKIILAPMGIIFGRMYRGENRYHKISKPSIYRNGITPSERFWERLKTSQLCMLIYNYPITHVFENGLWMDNGKFHINKLHIDVEAIAQHYGIKTNLMDFTVDKWVAAFFATATWDNNTHTYLPIKATKACGVIYQYDTDFIHTLGKEVRAIGLQPLARPEYQNGYVYRMGRKSELNSDIKMKRTLFSHDSIQNRMVCAYANRGNRLFPKELANNKIEEILNTRKFHPKAYEYIIEKYYRTTPPLVIERYMNEQSIELCEDIPHFTEEEIKSITTTWEHHDANRILKRLLRPIIIRDL